MNRLVALLLVIGCFLFAGCATSPESPVNPKGIHLVNVRGIDEALINRVAEFIGGNYDCPVRATVYDEPARKPPVTEAENLEQLMDESDVCLIALLELPEKDNFDEAIFRTPNVSLLNITALRPSGPLTAEAREKHMRRIESKSMRAIGLMIGLDTCPFPRCALSPAENASDLDSKGRNLCPPCHDRAIELLKAAGVRLLSDEFPGRIGNSAK